MSRPPVTLQISLAPSDYAHASVLLPHQISVWRGQVAEILLIVDCHRSAGRFSARWEEGRERIFPLARSIPGARVVGVDYAPTVQAEISARFFGGRPVPTKDYRGGPYYSYFFGLNAATHNHVLHVDSDMFFGGGSDTWLAEALDRLHQRPDIFVIAPLPGAPAADGSLRHLRGVRAPGSSLAYDFAEMSTRLFLLDRRRFRGDFGPITPRRPALKNRLKAWIDGNAPA
ncbi:MAG: hypothetical protein NTZ29_16860, partial [Verrucomicrobia bacterium]|nr:hypothetical protein [Verrucomicrobiota bacterium]